MVVKRVDPLSFAKITAILYALLGVCFGALFSLVGMAGVFQQAGAPGASLFFGAGAIVILPIFYGGLGFIFSLISAALYNLVAGWVGGVEFDVQ